MLIMKGELERIWKQPQPTSSNYPSIQLEGLRKFIRNLIQDNWYPDWDTILEIYQSTSLLSSIFNITYLWNTSQSCYHYISLFIFIVGSTTISLKGTPILGTKFSMSAGGQSQRTSTV